MHINGKEFKLQAPCTLLELLTQRNCPLDRVAVELNGTVIPKISFGETMVADDDRLEIVSFVGGG